MGVSTNQVREFRNFNDLLIVSAPCLSHHARLAIVRLGPREFGVRCQTAKERGGIEGKTHIFPVKPPSTITNTIEGQRSRLAGRAAGQFLTFL